MIIATAGHVDHGKTTLLQAISGINADRLPEEKRRGMTIDLGYAYWPQPDGRVLGFIDVPGHEIPRQYAGGRRRYRPCIAGGGLRRRRDGANPRASGDPAPERAPGADGGVDQGRPGGRGACRRGTPPGARRTGAPGLARCAAVCYRGGGGRASRCCARICWRYRPASAR